MSKTYNLPLTPDEVRSLFSAVSFSNPFEADNERAQVNNSLLRKATALKTYVEADMHAEEAEELFRETLEMDKEWYE